jgi:hypothetical protein
VISVPKPINESIEMSMITTKKIQSIVHKPNTEVRKIILNGGKQFNDLENVLR